jgi:hypothetical protein
MNDPDGLATLLTFARQEFAEDLVTFWVAIEEFKEVCSSYPSTIASPNPHILVRSLPLGCHRW